MVAIGRGCVATGFSVLLVVGSAQQVHGQVSQGAGLPAGDGRELVATACTQCHGLRTIMSMRDGGAGWKLYVYDMVLRGAQLNAAEANTVIDYLVKNFGPGVPLTGARAAAATALPAGPGRELVETRCVMCHDLERVTAAARTKEDWDQIVQNMVGRGAVATSDESQMIRSYLTTRFGRSS